MYHLFSKSKVLRTAKENSCEYRFEIIDLKKFAILLFVAGQLFF